MLERIAVYPGTFDPITLGHLDMIKDSSKIFDKIVVGLLVNPAKNPQFNEDARKLMIEESVADEGINNVEVKIFKGLAVRFARQEKAIAIIRGLRMTTEYEEELGLAFNNKVVGPDIITILFPPHQEHIHISSTVVRGLQSFDDSDDLDKYVPQAVLEHAGILEERYKKRIRAICHRLKKGDGLAETVASEIIKRYQELHRAYHALKHIDDSLNEFDTVKPTLKYPNAVEFEILCHDAIYDVRAKDNEEKSAEFAIKMAKLLGQTAAFGHRAAVSTLYTKHTILPPVENYDARVGVDIDLAPLGHSEREFDKNTAKIRREYSWVPEEKFNAGRIAFFKTLLPPNRPTIYLTQFFRDKYEAQAQKNIARAIAQLSK